MYQLQSRKNGFQLTLGQHVDAPDMHGFVFAIENELAGPNSPFVLVVDARYFHHFTADGQALFEECLDLARDNGLARVTVLAESTAHASLFCDMMIRAEIMPLYQFLDTIYEAEWASEMDIWLDEPFEKK